MERWVLYATLSMLFAGFTSVIAKMGMEGISAEQIGRASCRERV